MRRWVLAGLLAAGGCGGCSSPSAPGDAGKDASTDIGAGDVAQETGPTPCKPAPRPTYVPAGWIPYDDYAPCSGLYVPTDASQLPTTINWQDCEPAAGVTGCRRIQLNWSPVPGGDQFTDGDAAIDSQGHVIAITSRDFSDVQGGKLDHRIHVIADVDGPVYAAVMATQPWRALTLGFLAPAYTPPRWALRVLEYGMDTGGGYLAGTLPAVGPTVHNKFSSTTVHAAAVGDLGLLDIGSGVSLLDFDSGAHLQDIKSSLPMSFEWMFRSSVFWQGNSGRIADVGRWDPDAGSVDFINYGFDPNHAAGDLGTDGTDMVWLEGQGNSTDAGPYTTVAYWTSPYVTDPAKLQPRRLRSETTTAILGTPIAIGCGHAAYAPVGFTNGLRIVRLSDGWSWFLPNVKGWYWAQALALTCSEVFVTVQISGPITTMARVPLAQLGPGVAPD